MLPLKNQFIFAPIKTGYGDGSGVVTEKHLAFYGRRTKYLGAIIPEPFYMGKGLRELPAQLGIDHDDKIEGLKKLTALLHSTDTKAIAHLNHPGRMANPKIPGNYFVSSTDKACENGGAKPNSLSRDEIQGIVQLFVESAVRAQKADFDLIELQFGHGYLAAQFLSSFVNDRDDEYGGSFENRVRFPLEIFQAIKQAVDLPIVIRISGDEMIPQGIQLPEMQKFSELLEQKGASAIHVSAGSVCSTPPWFFQHMFIPKGKTWEMAKRIQSEIQIPVIFVGRVNSRMDVETLRNDYFADYIAIGRALVADPEFIGKYYHEVKGPIQPCLACAEGCLGGVRSGQGLQCLVNPEVGRETESIKPSAEPGKYAVVGGGLAGMQAAITLRKQGHHVDLYEKDALGGQFNFAPLTPHKRTMEMLVPYFKEALAFYKVNINFKEAVKSDLIASYDGILLATGSKPVVPLLPGLNKFYWADILLKENLPKDKKVLIIGGGLIGVDIATALIPRNNKVIIVKRTTDFGEDMEMIAKNLSLKEMKEKETLFSDYTHIRKIDGKTIYAERKGEQIQFDDVDIIVVSTGMKSHNPLEKEIKGEVPVYVIGDAKKTGNARDAIRDAYETARSL